MPLPKLGFTLIITCVLTTRSTVPFPLLFFRQQGSSLLLIDSKFGMATPERYKNEFIEACRVLLLSPKSSAALSRRLLQYILREHYGIPKSNLFDEIEEFIKQKDVPADLAKNVDEVRKVGNFAAHPLKYHTGEIVDVEPGEADWLLEVLESLFDFAFVQPARSKAKKKRLNEKL